MNFSRRSIYLNREVYTWHLIKTRWCACDDVAGDNRSIPDGKIVKRLDEEHESTQHAANDSEYHFNRRDHELNSAKRISDGQDIAKCALIIYQKHPSWGFLEGVLF